MGIERRKALHQSAETWRPLLIADSFVSDALYVDAVSNGDCIILGGR